MLVATLIAGCASPRSQAIEHFTLGEDYREQGEFELAIEEYTQAIALDPEHVDAYYKHRIANNELGNFDLAISILDLEKALELGLEPEERSFAEGLLEQLRQ
jgi:tetratricopeptide (TPR) repeat protein